MAGRYKGYFNSLDGNSYRVEIEKSGSTGDYTEIKLAGDNPFVVNYEASETPFDPVRTSTATINIVSDEYLDDIITPYAQGTRVSLYEEVGSTDVIQWTGFLTPQLYDMGYTYEYETISLNANDCIKTLQYVEYETISADTKQIVSFADLIREICNKSLNINGYYWATSKSVSRKTLYPTDLVISEYNFFTSDTEEPWKLDELLEQICKYVGLTCIQYKDKFYFIDYQEYEEEVVSLWLAWYPKSNGYIRNGNIFMGHERTIGEDTSYRGNSNDITFLPIYNKIRVNDNMYNVDEFIPSIFDDNYLTNRINSGSFYSYYEVQPEEGYAMFPKTLRVSNSVYWREAGDDGKWPDSAFTYYHRTYDNKYWDSKYYTASGATTTPSSTDLKSSAITRNYMGATIVDLGTVKREYRNEYGQLVVPDKMDYTRYLCICNKYNYLNYTFSDSRGEQIYTPEAVFKLKDGFKSPVIWGDKSYLVINYSLIWERYENRAYMNPEWITDTCGVGELQSGQILRGQGNLQFILQIGDKYWNGNAWTTGTPQSFVVVCERTMDQTDRWNEEMTALNNVSYDLEVGETGYKIPLEGVDTTAEVVFKILRPEPQFLYNSGNPDYFRPYHYNAYTWVKDLSIKCVQGGQDAPQEESDIVYENEIDVDSIHEMDEIDLKITTLSNLQKPSYSTVGYKSGSTIIPLQSVYEISTSSVALPPEQNIINKYIKQYRTPTKKLSLVLDLTVSPFDKIYNAYVDDPEQKYVVLGQDIDYKMGRQTITMIEKKMSNE